MNNQQLRDDDFHSQIFARSLFRENPELRVQKNKDETRITLCDMQIKDIDLWNVDQTVHTPSEYLPSYSLNSDQHPVIIEHQMTRSIINPNILPKNIRNLSNDGVNAYLSNEQNRDQSNSVRSLQLRSRFSNNLKNHIGNGIVSKDQ